MRPSSFILPGILTILLSTAVVTIGSTSLGTLENKNESQIEIVKSENDSTQQDQAKKEIAPVEKKKSDDEKSSVSILSVNVIFEIISHFNLSDLLTIPSK